MRLTYPVIEMHSHFTRPAENTHYMLENVGTESGRGNRLSACSAAATIKLPNSARVPDRNSSRDHIRRSRPTSAFQLRLESGLLSAYPTGPTIPTYGPIRPLGTPAVCRPESGQVPGSSVQAPSGRSLNGGRSNTLARFPSEE